MDTEREFLLNELEEHTVDCDCARSQHFYDEKVCRKKAKIFNCVKSITFLLTISSYVLIVSGIQENKWIQYLGIVLTLLSTLLEIMSYMLRFEEEAIEHWKSAQMYSELYRKCQFFCSDHARVYIEVWRVRLNDISEELSRISSLSPSLSSASYENWMKYSSTKKYPVHKAIKDLKITEIEKVISTIKEKMSDCKIEILLFGSYLNSMHYNDVDIAVIVHEDIQRIPLQDKMNDIEKEYSVQGINLDITIVPEVDIIANRCTMFIKNICEGECYYKSPEVKRSIKEEYMGAISNFPEMVSYFMEQAEKTESDYRAFTSNVFYVYYHALTGLLGKWGISWYGDKSMISECDLVAVDDDKMRKIGVDGSRFANMISHVRLFMDEKNTNYYNNQLNDNDLNILKGYYEEDKTIISDIIKFIM